MFAYCTEVLHLSEAYLRITAARASRRYPLLLSMLADGRLHLSGIGRPRRTSHRRMRTGFWSEPSIGPSGRSKG